MDPALKTSLEILIRAARDLTTAIDQLTEAVRESNNDDEIEEVLPTNLTEGI